MSIKNGVLGDGSFALFTALVVALAGTDVATAANQSDAPQIGKPPSATVNAGGFDNKPFEQNFLDRFSSFSDSQLNHAPVGMTVPGPTAILTAGVGLLMIGSRRRPT